MLADSAVTQRDINGRFRDGGTPATPLHTQLGLSEARLSDLVAMLPGVEATVMRRLLQGDRQRDVAPDLGCSQPAISFMRRRAIQRLRWMADWVDRFSADELRRDFVVPLRGWERAGEARLDVEICAVYWETGSMTRAAEAVGRQPNTVGIRLKALLADPALERLADEHGARLYLDGLRSLHVAGARSLRVRLRGSLL